jgi:predicted TIM-barrel fold metal-dependent hydrolase
MDRAWRDGFAALAPLNLSFEAWMFHSQLGDLIDLARAFPETKIVLNHIGGALAVGPYADKRKEVFDEWRTQMQKLGQFPNVYIKLGGLGMPSRMGFEMGQQAEAPSSEQLAKAWKPYLDTCIEAFGPDRGMFESNFPVDKGMCSYANLWNAFKRVAESYSNDEKNAMFHNTALKFYRLW